MNISKLVYPIPGTGNKKKGEAPKMATLIVLGVKQRTIIHASFVNDFLEQMKP